MKIVNICFAAPYHEGFSYQENILPEYFILKGIESTIISYDKENKLSEKFINGVKITRIKCLRFSSNVSIAFGLYRELKKERPNVIFHHNVNFFTLIICVLYKLLNKGTVLFVDNHADSINCSKNIIYHTIYEKFILRLLLFLFINHHVKKYYGVSYGRCDYLKHVYGINNNKIDFLPIGADLITSDKINKNKYYLREEYGISKDKFVIVSGGKMGIDKGTDILINEVANLNNQGYNILLILFGRFNDNETEQLSKKYIFVCYFGWRNHIDSMKLLKLADVAIWSIHHTTLIEDAIAVNTPLILYKTRTTEHLIENNGVFLMSRESNELYSAIKSIIDNYKEMDLANACEQIKNKLDYNNIVSKILDDINI